MTQTSAEPFQVRVPVSTLWTASDAPRDVDAAAVSDPPDVAGWTAAMDAEVRKGLGGRTLTQLLLGEDVHVVEEHEEWVRVVAPQQPSSQDPAGYPGWMPRAHLGAPVPHPEGRSCFVMTPRAPCTLDDGATLELSFGTGLRVDEISEADAVVLLPDHRQGRTPLEHVRVVDGGQHRGQHQTHGPGDLLTSARQFLGLRYLWGGTSAWGMDCSGLVHLVYRAHGVVVPRDAYDQADVVEPVHLEDVQPGDLYFFARAHERIYHVGFVTRPFDADAERWMLHAPESGEFVEDAPLAPHRSGTLVSAGRFRQP